MSNDDYQERAWVLGAFTTIGFVAISGVIGSIYSVNNSAAIFGFCVLICASIINTLTNKLAAIRADKNAAIAAIKVEQVSIKAGVAAEKAGVAAVKAEEASALVQENAAHADERAEVITKLAESSLQMGESNHKLLNSAKGELLDRIAALARRLAELTGEESDKEIADVEEKTSADHAKNQSLIATQPPDTTKVLREAAKDEVHPAVRSTVKAAQDTAKAAQSTAKSAQDTAKAAQATAQKIAQEKK